MSLNRYFPLNFVFAPIWLSPTMRYSKKELRENVDLETFSRLGHRSVSTHVLALSSDCVSVSRCLSKTQCENLEAIQRRTLRIIFPVTIGMPYILVLGYAQTSPLHTRREEANKRFSRSCLTLLLVFSPYCLHPETVVLLLESDLQQLPSSIY